MHKELQHCCPDIARTLDENRAYIGYSPKVREYHINLRNEPVIVYLIAYCPWCGKKLPKSLRMKWFRTLKSEHNLDDPWGKEQEKLIPEEFNSDAWWKKRGL